MVPGARHFNAQQLRLLSQGTRIPGFLLILIVQGHGDSFMTSSKAWSAASGQSQIQSSWQCPSVERTPVRTSRNGGTTAAGFVCCPSSGANGDKWLLQIPRPHSQERDSGRPSAGQALTVREEAGLRKVPVLWFQPP